MAKQFLKRWSPDPNKIQNSRVLRVFGRMLRYDYLWRLQRSSAARGLAVGLFCCWMPVPFQMIMAAAGAIIFRGFMPLSMASVWLTNPVTMLPAMVFAFQIGQVILGGSTDTEGITAAFNGLLTMELTRESAAAVWTSLNGIWAPLLAGCILLGAATAGIGYFVVMETWRISVMRRWKSRHIKWEGWREKRTQRTLAAKETLALSFSKDDKVIVMAIYDSTLQVPLQADIKTPEVNDQARIVAIHKTPTPGYELEGISSDGSVIWRRAAEPSDLALKKI